MPRFILLNSSFLLRLTQLLLKAHNRIKRTFTNKVFVHLQYIKSKSKIHKCCKNSSNNYGRVRVNKFSVIVECTKITLVNVPNMRNGAFLNLSIPKENGGKK